MKLNVRKASMGSSVSTNKTVFWLKSKYRLIRIICYHVFFSSAYPCDFSCKHCQLKRFLSGFINLDQGIYYTSFSLKVNSGKTYWHVFLRWLEIVFTCEIRNWGRTFSGNRFTSRSEKVPGEDPEIRCFRTSWTWTGPTPPCAGN